MRLAFPTLIVAGLLLSGCSSGEPSTFKAAPTAKCLGGKGYRVTTDDAQAGVVAANAPNGGLLAREPGNALTIAFGADSDDAIKIADVLRTQKNAVLLWTVTPPQEEQDKVFACLKG